MSSGESSNAPTSPERPAESAETVFVCPVCPKPITSRDKLRSHISKHMRPTNFKCTICADRFVIKPDLIRHVKRTHRNGCTETRTITKYQNAILDYCCRVCQESITSKMLLERHTLEHNNQKDAPFHCRRCLKGFSTQTELTEHKEYEHGGPAQVYRLPTPTFECFDCKKVLHTRRTYEEHLRLHSKEFHYYCKECNKGFMRKYQLAQHMETPHVTSTQEVEPIPPPAPTPPPTDLTKLHSSDFLYLCCAGRFGDFERKKLVKFLKTYWKKEDQRERLDAVLSKAKVDPEELEELVTDMEQFLRTWLEVNQIFGDTAMMQQSTRVRDGIYLPKIVEKRMDQMSQKFTDLYY